MTCYLLPEGIQIEEAGLAAKGQAIFRRASTGKYQIVPTLDSQIECLERYAADKNRTAGDREFYGGKLLKLQDVLSRPDQLDLPADETDSDSEG